jgi:mannosyltransferase
MPRETDHLLLKVESSEPRATRDAGATVFLLAVAVFVAARLWRLNAFDFWADELTTLEAVRRDWTSLFTFVVTDVVHPPLFYVLLKLWMVIGGEGTMWLRLFPSLTSIASIIPFYLLCRELNLRISQTGFALLLASVNGYLIYYAQELRMYSLVLFLTVCSMWRFVRFFNVPSRTNFLVLFVVNLLLVYAHYFGWLVVGAESIFSMAWGRRKFYWFSLGAAALIVCYAPWLYAVSQAAVGKGGLSPNLSWIQQPTLRDLIWPYVILNGPLPSTWPSRASLLGLFLFGYPVALWILHTHRSRDEEANPKAALWWLLLLCGLPVAIAWLASRVLAYPVWHPRYLIIVAAPYFILVGIALGRLRPAWLRVSTMLLAVGWAALSGVMEMRRTDRLRWRALVGQMIQAETTSTKPVTVYTFGSQDIQFYLDEAGEKRFELVRGRTKRNQQSWGDRFWISFRSAGDPYRVAFFHAAQWEEQKLAALKRSLSEKGYHFGKGFEAGSPGYRGFLFPVWRNTVGAR